MSNSDKTPASARRGPRRRLALKLAILSGTTLLGLLLLEFAIRLIFPYYSPSTQVPFYNNADGLVLGQPLKTSRQRTPKGDFDTTVSFNRLGFRDTRDLTRSSPSDIFVAGDSFSIGWGVEETQRFSNVLERDLATPCYNICIPEDIRGYIATVKYAEQQGAKIGHLVIGLCMENDVWDYTVPISTHEIYARQMNKGVVRSAVKWIRSRSALWICLSHVMQKTAAGRSLFEKLGLAKNIEAMTHKNDYSPKILAATRDELLKLTTNYNSVVLVIPSRGLWHGQNIAVEDKIHSELVALLRESGVKLVDMRPVFEKTGRPLQFYFTSDPHWNTNGHKLAGETLAQYLRALPDWKTAPGLR